MYININESNNENNEESYENEEENEIFCIMKWK